MSGQTKTPYIILRSDGEEMLYAKAKSREELERLIRTKISSEDIEGEELVIYKQVGTLESFYEPPPIHIYWDEEE